MQKTARIHHNIMLPYTEFTKEVLADGRKKERLHSHEAR
mgnify:CR=1 FL=1